MRSGLNVDLPPLDRDEINAERTRQPDSEEATIGSDWDWTTMTQADLMQHALPVLAANADMCGDKVIRYRGEMVCDFFPFYLSNESHPNAYTDGVDFIYVTAGMVRSLRSADEYRAVIGHEIGHIISGHVEKVQRRHNRGALIGAVVGLGLAAAAANEGIAVPPSVVTSAAHIGAVFGTLRFSEQHELEADYIGAYMLARSCTATMLNTRPRIGWQPLLAHFDAPSLGLSKSTEIESSSRRASRKTVASWCKQSSESPS